MSWKKALRDIGLEVDHAYLTERLDKETNQPIYEFAFEFEHEVDAILKYDELKYSILEIGEKRFSFTPVKLTEQGMTIPNRQYFKCTSMTVRNINRENAAVKSVIFISAIQKPYRPDEMKWEDF